MRAAGAALLLGAIGCPASAPARPAAPGSHSATSPVAPSGRSIRVALVVGAAFGHVSATGDWRLFHSGGSGLLVRGTGRGVWRVERHGDRLRVTNSSGTMTATRSGPLIARASGPGVSMLWDGHRYRGEVVITPAPDTTGLLVVNRIGLEDYLRGVVPVELGEASAADLAAMEAQAVAARSYAVVRLQDPDAPLRPYDLLATTADQLYGGADAERLLTDAAVSATAGEVLTYAGHVVNAPYHAACGGRTAAPTEVWHTTETSPYLQSVSDRIPGTQHYYCELSTQFRWTQTYTRPQLAAVLERYLPQYAATHGGPLGVSLGAPPRVPVGAAHGATIGRIRAIQAAPPTASGRVSGITVLTDRGRYDVRGNDVRFVLRTPDGAVLRSTAFFLESVAGADGDLATLTVQGVGNGHGVGMCQWGAIGRARAGQDYRMILAAYYRGTIVARAA